MIRMSLFRFDSDKRMNRITAEALVEPEVFDPEWISQPAMKQAFDDAIGDQPADPTKPDRFFALIENVKVQDEPAA